MRRLSSTCIVLFTFMIVGATAILSTYWPLVFQRYFGGVDPLGVIVLLAIFGYVSLLYLDSRCGFAIYKQGACLKGVTGSIIIATLFAFAVILVDVFFRYPEDLNVLLPQALLFYPVMGYLAEITFHIIPLAVLLFFLNRKQHAGTDHYLVWLCIIFVSLTEPVFQLSFEERPLSPTGIYTGFHVFGFSLVQLYIYRRYDFVSMYIFRLVYYFYWHIAWGYLRLKWLF